ncbi:efflux RND transporter periplasmic adaptor subunit, partial [Paenibacillus chartarius]
KEENTRKSQKNGENINLLREVKVKEGDAVKKGQTLIVLDSAPAAKSLADEQDRYAKQQLELEKLQDALKQNGIGGEASKMDDMKRQIAALKLDMSIQARKIESIRSDISENGSVTAPFDGLIIDIQADEGVPASPGKALVQIADSSQGWTLQARVDADAAERLVTGETVDVRIKETTPRYVKGKVSEVDYSEEGGGQPASSGATATKLVTLDIDDPKLSGGELADFSLTKKAGTPRPLVPVAALRSDSQGEYMFTIVETKRPLGNEFRVSKKYVHTEDADGTNALLNGGIGLEDKIVTESSEPLSDGDQVRLN